MSVRMMTAAAHMQLSIWPDSERTGRAETSDKASHVIDSDLMYRVGVIIAVYCYAVQSCGRPERSSSYCLSSFTFFFSASLLLSRLSLD